LNRSGRFPKRSGTGCGRAGPGGLRVLLVGANRAYGGAERHMADLSAGLTRRGWLVACLFPAGNGLERRLAPGVRALPVAGLQSARRFPAELRRAVRAFRPDIVHLHGPRATLLGRLALRLVGTGGARPALVTTAHGWIPRRLGLSPLYEALYLATARLDQVTIAVSRDTARRYGRWAPGLRVVPNGVERPDRLPPYRASPDRPAVRVGFVGRLTEEKDFPLALAVRRALASALPGRRVELHVYGDGPLLETARSEAGRQAGCGATFHGWVEPEEVPAVMGGLTLLLVSSREEGCPYVILEAMGAGCPVVAAAAPSLPARRRPGRVCRGREAGSRARPGNPDAGGCLAQGRPLLPRKHGASCGRSLQSSPPRGVKRAASQGGRPAPDRAAVSLPAGKVAPGRAAQTP